MSEMALKETIKFFQSYGVKSDEKLVREWLNTGSRKEKTRKGPCENDLYDFNEWCRWKCTAYEIGIDDQTKIARLLEEV